MTRFRQILRHPFWQAVLLLVVSYLAFTIGVRYVPPLFGVSSAPVPHSVVLQYMLIAVVGILIFVSSDELRWRTFKEPLHATLVDSDKRWLRLALLVAVPVLLGFATYQQARPRVDAHRRANGSTDPGPDAIGHALAGHLCRCGAYAAIGAAVAAACRGEFDGPDVTFVNAEIARIENDAVETVVVFQSKLEDGNAGFEGHDDAHGVGQREIVRGREMLVDQEQRGKFAQARSRRRH